MQERGCLMHFARLANTLLKDEEIARDNHVFDCNFAKHSKKSSYLVVSNSENCELTALIQRNTRFRDFKLNLLREMTKGKYEGHSLCLTFLLRILL